MHVFRIPVTAALAFGAMIAAPAFAHPTFQAYINGASAGTIGSDEETWFRADSSFDLSIVGAYKDKFKDGDDDVSIRSVTLLLSVPKGEQGTFTITSATDETPIQVSTAGGVTGSPLNPSTNADTNVLTDVVGLDGYGTKNFLPDGVSFNNHFPFQAGESDFLLFDLGAFDKSDSGFLSNYDADGSGSITPLERDGEQKEYTVSFTGFSQVHFDVYGYIDTVDGHREDTSWNINPGSHDSTAQAVPAPGAFLMGFLGLGLVGMLRRRRTAV